MSIVKSNPPIVTSNPIVTKGHIAPHAEVIHATKVAKLNQNQQWAAGFCECCSYVEVGDDGQSSCMWCPYFIPMGLCGTCCLLGRIQTLLVKEDVKCCGMGSEGCMCCIVSTPINILGPFGGFCWFAFNSMNMRRMVVDKYNIKENSACPTMCIGICFPLSLFQVLMKLRQLDIDREL